MFALAKKNVKYRIAMDTLVQTEVSTFLYGGKVDYRAGAAHYIVLVLGSIFYAIRLDDNVDKI